MTTGWTRATGKGSQATASNYPSTVSQPFPVLSNRANSVELMRIELMASRVRFWQPGRENRDMP